MRTSTAIGVGVLAIGGAVAAVAVLQRMAADEEAPIVVKNGTLDIVAGVSADNEFSWEAEPEDSEEATPSYSYEPATKYLDRSKDHWVKISMQSGTCTPNQLTATGRVVRVEYTYDPGTGVQKKDFTLKRGRSGIFNYRTKVRPQGDLTPGKDATSGRPKLSFDLKGFISTVQVGGWSCTFPDAAADPQLTVCSSANRKECQ